MATSCGSTFFASATTPIPKNRMQAPSVAPSTGVYRAYISWPGSYAGTHSFGHQMNTTAEMTPNSAASRNHMATLRSARLSAGEPGT